MDRTINPGLLYNRLYFVNGLSNILGEKEWLNSLKSIHEQKQKQKYPTKPEKRKAFKAPKSPKFSPQKDLVEDSSSQEAQSHFSLRNHYLFHFNYPTSSIGGIAPSKNSLKVELKTTYPGLAVGLGYNHQISSKEAINGGFSFDHTTGLPVIPGSSVKGILRAAFPGEDLRRAADCDASVLKVNKDNKLSPEEKLDEVSTLSASAAWYRQGASAKVNVIMTALEEINKTSTARFEMPANPTVFLQKLELELFASEVDDPYATGDKGEKLHLPIPTRVVFHDAEIIAAEGKLFGPDNITPHLNRRPNNGLNEDEKVPDRYVEPTPISLLKVMSGVTFSFRFTLPAYYDLLVRDTLHRQYPTLPPAVVRLLFKHLLLTYGAGAKTRVGYGRFSEDLKDTVSRSINYSAFGNHGFGALPDLPEADNDRLVNETTKEEGAAVVESPTDKGNTRKEEPSPAPNEKPALHKDQKIEIVYKEKRGGGKFCFDVPAYEVIIATKRKQQPNFPPKIEAGDKFTARIDSMDGEVIESFHIL